MGGYSERSRGLQMRARLAELATPSPDLGKRVTSFADRWEMENGPAAERPYSFAVAFALEMFASQSAASAETSKPRGKRQ